MDPMIGACASLTHQLQNANPPALTRPAPSVTSQPQTADGVIDTARLTYAPTAKISEGACTTQARPAAAGVKGELQAVGMASPTVARACPDPLPAFTIAQQQDGSWTLIDPQGKKFFSVGVNCVSSKDEGGPPGPKYDGLAEFGGDYNKWAAQTLQRFAAWNFNTIGGWSQLRGLPFTIDLTLVSDYSLGEVFNPNFEDMVRSNAAVGIAQQCGNAATLDADRNFIGCFTDNELYWGKGYSWMNPKQWSQFELFAKFPVDHPAKKAWAQYMAEAYNNDFDRLSRVWNVDVHSLDELERVQQIAPRSPQYFAEGVRVGDGFLHRVADRYYGVVNRVVKELLPHHLNLGSRLTFDNRDAVIQEAGRYNDVVSLNMYTLDLDVFSDQASRVHELTGKPVIVTEFSYPARQNRSGNSNAGYDRCEVPDDEKRGEMFARTTDMLSGLPFVVGYQWFQFFDEPTNGRADGECCNFGLVDLQNRPYENLVTAASDANARAQQRAAQRGAKSDEVRR